MIRGPRPTVCLGPAPWRQIGARWLGRRPLGRGRLSGSLSRWGFSAAEPQARRRAACAGERRCSWALFVCARPALARDPVLSFRVIVWRCRACSTVAGRPRRVSLLGSRTGVRFACSSSRQQRPQRLQRRQRQQAAGTAAAAAGGSVTAAAASGEQHASGTSGQAAAVSSAATPAARAATAATAPAGAASSATARSARVAMALGRHGTATL